MGSISPSVNSARSAGISDIGRVRGENQDAILADDDLGLWLVADGMGGHAGGARASVIARDTVRERYSQGDDLGDAVLAAHHAICAGQRQSTDFSDMGTTVVVAAEKPDSAGVEIRWVGDSRAYCFSQSNSRLELLTDDHNVAGMLVASGALSRDEAARHPQRHVLTDCLGLAGEEGPRVGSAYHGWKAGDVLLLCSDGLSGEVSEAEIVRELSSSESLDGLARALLENAMAAGAHDNVSLVLVAAPEGVQRPRTRTLWRRLFDRT